MEKRRQNTPQEPICYENLIEQFLALTGSWLFDQRYRLLYPIKKYGIKLNYFKPDQETTAQIIYEWSCKEEDAKFISNSEDDDTIKITDQIVNVKMLISDINKALASNDRYETIRFAEGNDALYVYVPEVRPEWKLVKPEFRVAAMPAENLYDCISDIVRTMPEKVIFDLSKLDKEERHAEFLDKYVFVEFPSLNSARNKGKIKDFLELIDEECSYYTQETQRKVANEDFNTSKPITPLTQSQILSFMKNVRKAAPGIPPMSNTFSIGYASEQTAKMVAAAYRGGRGSVNKETGERLENVRIIKCSEFRGAYLEDYSKSKIVKAQRKDEEPGTEHKRAGFTKVTTGEEAENTKALFTSDRTGEFAIGPLFKTNFDPAKDVRVKYFISINDSDLREATKEELEKYCTPSALKPSVKVPKLDDQGQEIKTRPTFTFLFSGIYMIGDQGHSIM